MPLRVSRLRRNADPAPPIEPGPARPTTLSKALRGFHDDELGGAYTLSYVMVFPFMMLLIALLVETVLMMNSKLGTVYSAYAAARAASVWSSADQWPDAQRRIEKAARQAMVPFASGSNRDGGAVAEEDDYQRAYQAWVDDPVSAGYVRAKMRDAFNNMQVEVERPSQWDSEIKVRLTYQYPFRVPGLGRLLGQQQSSGSYTFPLTTEVSLQNEGPQNPTQTLGIPYGSPD
jgi:hypothetical protein